MATRESRSIGRRAEPGEPVSSFLSLLRSSDAVLRAEFARSAVLKHATTKGTLRETAVRPLARQLFPRRYEIASGEIINAAGDTSRAQDVIIYDPNVVAGWHVPDANAVLPAEAVVASVEVKSNATRSTINGAIDNLATVKRVFGHRPRSGLASDLVIDETTARPMGLALFFESRLGWPKFTEAVSSAVTAVAPEERPDVWLLLGRGGLTWPPDETGKPLAARTSATDMLVFEGADSNLVLAYAISSHVLTWVPPRLDLFDYAKRQPSGLDLTLTRRSLNPPASAR